MPRSSILARRVPRALAALSTLAAFAAVPRAASAQLTGQTVGLEYRVDQLSFVRALGTPVVGPGVEAVYNDCISVDALDRGLALTVNGSVCPVVLFNASSGFQGFRLFAVASPFPTLATVALSPTTNVAGFAGSRLSVTGTELRIDLRGLTLRRGDRIQADVTFASEGPNGPPTTTTPEPASIATVGVGLAALGAARLRRRTARV